MQVYWTLFHYLEFLLQFYLNPKEYHFLVVILCSKNISLYHLRLIVINTNQYQFIHWPIHSEAEIGPMHILNNDSSLYISFNIVHSMSNMGYYGLLDISYLSHVFRFQHFHSLGVTKKCSTMLIHTYQLCFVIVFARLDFIFR